MEEFVPKRAWGIACEAHSASLPTDRSVQSFHSAVLGRGIRGAELMIDAEGLAPKFHGFGYEFAIVGGEDAECLATLYCNGFVPGLKGRIGIAFGTEGDGPNVTRKIVNDIHTVQGTSRPMAHTNPHRPDPNVCSL